MESLSRFLMQRPPSQLSTEAPIANLEDSTNFLIITDLGELNSKKLNTLWFNFGEATIC